VRYIYIYLIYTYIYIIIQNTISADPARSKGERAREEGFVTTSTTTTTTTTTTTEKQLASAAAAAARAAAAAAAKWLQAAVCKEFLTLLCLRVRQHMSNTRTLNASPVCEALPS
jgi:hypothetical protein